MTTPAFVPFTMTQESITVVIDGRIHTFQAGTPQYHGLRDCIFREDWDAIARHVTLSGALQQWLGDKFVVADNVISYQDAPLPTSLSERIFAMAAGGESPAPLFAFYERLSRNPSWRSVQRLWDFLAHIGIPLEPDGTFLTYKGVREDFYDQYSGKFLNEPGQVHRMMRNRISDDSSRTCDQGFHVGALRYAMNWGPRVVIVRVDPEHVVSVPDDYSGEKMRVCEYAVVGNWVASAGEDGLPTATMPSTVYDINEDEDEDEDGDWTGDVEYEDEHEGPDKVELAEGDEQTDRGERPPAKVVLTTKPTGPKAATFNRKSPGALMEQSIDDLRKYASAHLKIVGAYKLAGGKAKLVSAILKARRKRQRR
jgi:hypothetical protein